MMWLSAVAFILTGPAVHAESFRYDYTYYNPGIGYYNFVYESPSLITTDEGPLTPSSCTALGSPCNQVAILAASGKVQIWGANTLSISNLPASFFQVGSNTSGFSSMSIRQNADASPVPEPSSLALFGTGIAGVAMKLRRSRRRLLV
ncbi:PEP-CTERM sorting domain-containing protein [Edaphobacter sp. 12200R-103]|nr:PEP-CTERM sorting domain-containing protein [Edaphobacter sp. 12200R-103]